MHEPDKDPDDSLIGNKRFTLQWMANITLFGGFVISLIGAILTIISRKGIFLIIPIIAIGISVLVAELAQRNNAERARSTAALAIIINIILFIIIFLIYLFVKEATQKF